MPDITVLAYPASAHNEEYLITHVVSLRTRQGTAPGSRLAVAACGQSDIAINSDDVRRLACSDGVATERYAVRLVRPKELFDTVLGLLIATARARAATTSLVRGPYGNSPNALMDRVEGNHLAWTGWL